MSLLYAESSIFLSPATGNGVLFWMALFLNAQAECYLFSLFLCQEKGREVFANWNSRFRHILQTNFADTKETEIKKSLWESFKKTFLVFPATRFWEQLLIRG
jgi:hypothetical protein